MVQWYSLDIYRAITRPNPIHPPVITTTLSDVNFRGVGCRNSSLTKCKVTTKRTNSTNPKTTKLNRVSRQQRGYIHTIIKKE